MTIIYCDLCGKALPRSLSATNVRISEYSADSCDDCARKLINYVKSRKGFVDLDKMGVKSD